MNDPARLAELLDAALPQTQCTRCGFPDCRAYAQAMAEGTADINRCPPGGAEGIVRLAALRGLPIRPLDPERGHEGPRALAEIDEDWCIGCTLCIQACPMDCIVGAARQMHTVVGADCSGCELCVAACPVDCIAMIPRPATAGAPPAADANRARFAARNARLAQRATERATLLAARKQLAR